MKYDQCKVGLVVWDRWFVHWGLGKIEKVGKTRIGVRFSNEGYVSYDKQHLQFLEFERN